jgi:hypothetical protein
MRSVEASPVALNDQGWVGGDTPPPAVGASLLRNDELGRALQPRLDEHVDLVYQAKVVATPFFIPS